MAEKTYTTGEVVDLLDSHEFMEDHMMSSLDAADLDGESEDGDCAEGDGFAGDGSAMLLPPEYLSAEASHLLLDSIGDILPAERDSLLMSESEEDEFNEVSSDSTG